MCFSFLKNELKNSTELAYMQKREATIWASLTDYMCREWIIIVSVYSEIMMFLKALPKIR
ncbi:hypothetical protein M2137_002350 [Parabacteroides sp. PFB2-10]|nr:hypothetical protein [Parabacteroides sp. PFB2-10]